MKGIIKEYLESQARIDPCFKEKYKAELIDRCIKYIWKLAKEIANNSKDKNCIAIKDEEVFKWSRDYFNDEIWKKEEEDFPPWNDEDEKNLDERIAESRQKAEEYRIKKEEEKRNKLEHANGQMTIFDLIGG